MKTILPDRLVLEAQRARLLSQPAMEKLLREQLKAKHLDEFFAAMGRMVEAPEPPAMSPEEVAEEIRVMRAERRAKASD